MKKFTSPSGGSTTNKTKSADLELKLKRALADYQNLQKRHQADRLEYAKFATSILVGKLITVLDDLERAKNHLKDKGLNLAIDQFKSVLVNEGMEPLSLKNTPFDPKTAECIELVDGPKDKIVSINQEGFLFHGKVLRPAQVKVGNGITNKK